MKDADRLYIAVDLGAGSGRVFLAGVGPDELMLEEARRFHYLPRRADGHLRWDAQHILAEIKAGLSAAAARARELGRRVQSIGVDGWGVDYGLVDESGRLVEDPVCYRDERTDGIMDIVFERVPREELFARTGIQILPFNTVFQLFAHVASGLPASATRLLLVPDLVNALLTGRAATEFTNGTTTQMLNAATHRWDEQVIDRLDLPGELLCPIVPAGEAFGPLVPDIAAETGLQNTGVVAPATHDTGSAVAGAPLLPGWAYISSGTWSLVGVERSGALIDAEVARHNFTNEGGANGTTRFLKNVAGLWLLESCRREWQEQEQAADYDHLLQRAAALDESPSLIFPDDPRFLNPPSMLEAMREQMLENGEPAPTQPSVLTRVILDSLALRYASVLRTIESLTHAAIQGVQIVGGGSRNIYLNQATATATGKPVRAGPVEATVIGNVLVQAVAARRFGSLSEARRHVAGNVRPTVFTPARTAAWDRAERRYASIEAQYLMARVDSS